MKAQMVNFISDDIYLPTLKQRYARSLYEVAQKNKQTKEVLKDLVLMETLMSNADLKMITYCRYIPFVKKKTIISRLLDKANIQTTIVKNVLLTLCEHNRLNTLKGVIDCYMQYEKKDQGIQWCRVYHADYALGPQVKKSIAKMLESLIPQKKIEITYHPTALITAGLRIMIGEICYDMTIDTVLNKMVHSAKKLM
jgi:ATP synthase F1 delta subunit